MASCVKKSQTNKRQVLTAFNDHFIEFLDDVCNVFPDNKDIMSAKNALITFRKMNPKLLISVFKDSVANVYREELFNGNLDYFVEKDYSNDIFDIDNTSNILEKINKLRDPIKNMNETEQTKVLKYMNNLIKLCDIYYEI